MNLLSFLFLFSALISDGSWSGALSTVSGTITDATTSEPVPFAYLHLEEINRAVTADYKGEFRFQNVPEGTYTLSVHRVGFRAREIKITVDENDTESIEIQLHPEAFSGEEVTITGTDESATGGQLEHASSKILGEELRRNLGTTLSETLSGSPGFSERSSGPAPGRPVIRGLGDERVLILQDGERTGDVSAQSSDHAVSVDPMGAEEIEIARGPAALAYGSNAIGGVINVVRNQIPTTVPNRFSGTVSLQGKTVNKEGAGAVAAAIPLDKWAAKIDLNGRLGSDFSTPAGSVTNSYVENTHNTIGLSRIGGNGYIGASGSAYLSNYGIPPDPDGGHPGGVDIEMRKLQFDVRGERVLQNSFFNYLEGRYSFVNYNHVEFESNGQRGTEFGQLNTNFSLKTRHSGWWFFNEGLMGLWGEILDYAVAGARTPDANQYSGAAYIVQEADMRPLHLELGSRYEYVLARPKEERTSSQIGEISERSFSALATSLSAIYNLRRNLFVGSTFMHSFRAPSLEELYSEGPHLAAYSYEIGNPELDPERGVGLELFLRYRSDRFSAELAGYRNHFQNYLYAQDTGETSVTDPSLNNFQFVGEEALFYGVEFSGEADLTRTITLGGSLSYTVAERDVSEEEQTTTGYDGSTRPLPMIPPLQGNIFARYSHKNLTVTSRFKLADEQTRLGEFETATDGYMVADANAQYRFSGGDLLHTLSLNVQNIFNRSYENHLSRIKEIFPEPGRNVSLLYRVYF